MTTQTTPTELLALAERLEAFVPRGELGALHGAGMAFAYADVAKELRHLATTLSAREDGWQLVPVEPTEEMWAAAIEASVDAEEIYDKDRPAEVWERFGLRKNRIRHQYNAMLDAAPKAPTAGEG